MGLQTKLLIDGIPKDHSLAARWAMALRDLEVRYPDPEVWVELKLTTAEQPVFTLVVGNVMDTRSGHRKSELVISCVTLAIWPGEELCRMWVAAAWAGYLQHEALELVTYNLKSPLDPHEEPYEANPFNRGLRDGLPARLDGPALIKALATVMDEISATNLVRVYHLQTPEMPVTPHEVPKALQQQMDWDLSNIEGKN